MLLREIDILLRATAKGYTAVEKDSRVSWSHQDLAGVAAEGAFASPDDLVGASSGLGVEGPFPGCLQQYADPNRYRLVGQTTHFIIFGPERDGAGRRFSVRPGSML